MAAFTIDLFSGGVRQGAGPLTTASRVSVSRRLDQAGSWTIEAPGTDPATAEVIAKRLAQVYALLGTPASRVLTNYGGGVVDAITRRADVETGEVSFTFSGDDLLGDLANTSVLDLELSNGSGGPITIAAAIALIAPLVPAWTFDTTTYQSTGTTTSASTSVTGVTNVQNFMVGGVIVGAGIPANTTITNIVGTTITMSAAATASATVTLAGAVIYLKFAGESVLSALNKIATTIGHHFCMVTNYAVLWRFKVQPSSGLRIISAGDQALIDNDEVALLEQSLEVVSDTHDIVTRLYPYGSGVGTARITLNNATAVAPAGYTMHIDAVPARSYIQHDAGVATYGVIERQAVFKDTGPAGSLVGGDTTEKRVSGNQVLTQAVESLRLSTQPQVTYRFSLVKLDRVVNPGETVDLIFRRTVDGYQAMDELATLVVLESTVQFDSSGATRTTAMTVATLDRWPASSLETLGGAITQAASMEAHAQTVPRAVVADTASAVSDANVALLNAANLFAALQSIRLDDAVNNAVSTVLALRHTTSGTAATGIGTRVIFEAEDDSGTAQQIASISALLADAATGTRKGEVRFNVSDTTARECLRLGTSGSAAKLSFYGVSTVTRPTALTQTYSTASRTLPAYTTDTESVAYTGATDGEAKLTDLNSLRVAYENLRTSHDALMQFVNALVDDLQLLGLEQ